MNNIDTIINEKIQKNPKIEIFNITFDSKKLWVKRARKTGSNMFHKLMYKLTKNPLLVPVQNKKPKESIEYEANKLAKLHALNISVPKLIAKEENYFIIEDCGSTVAHLFYHNEVKNPMLVCETIIRQLAALHNLGEFHGGSQLRNFTYEKTKIYFIDFEESFDNSININELQFRDLFLFLFSIQKMNIDVDIISIIDLYCKLTKKTDIKKRFHILTQKVSLLIKIIENKYIWKILDNDSKNVYKLLQELKK